MKITTNHEKTKNKKSIKKLLKITIFIIVGLIVIFAVLAEFSVYISAFIKDNIYSSRMNISQSSQKQAIQGLYNYFRIFDLDNVSHGKYIEVSLGDRGDYKVEFFYKEKSEYIIISTHNTTYDKYLYAIPNYIAKDGFDKIRISVLSGDNEFWVTDVKVHDDVDFTKFTDYEIVDFEIKLLDISIDRDNLKAIAQHRANAVKRSRILPDDIIYYQANIRVEGKSSDAQMRLKGGYSDHVSTDKWSFRIKLDDECVWGMEKFAIHRPQSRNGIYEYILHDMFEKSGGVSQKYDYVHLVINGEYWGIYALEQGIDKLVVENSLKREGVVLNYERTYTSLRTAYYNNYKFPIEVSSHLKVYSEGKVISNEYLYNYAQYAIDAFSKALNNEVNISNIIDFDQYAKYLALCDAFKGNHGLNLANSLFYYNPVTARLEPISHDMLGMYGSYVPTTVYRDTSLSRHVFDYPEFVELYKKYLIMFVTEYDDYLQENKEQLEQLDYILKLDNCDNFDYINGFDEHHKFVLDTIDSENSEFYLKQDEVGQYYLEINSNSIINVDVQKIIVDGKQLDIEFNGRELRINIDNNIASMLKKMQVQYRPLYKVNADTITKDVTIQVG